MCANHFTLDSPRRIQSRLFTGGASRSESPPPASSTRPPNRLAVWRAMLLLLGTGFLTGPAAGQNYWVLHSFTGIDGTEPHAGLILSGDTLYGATEHGGYWGQGALFRMNTDGSGYTVLKRFTDSQGGTGPDGDLVLSGQTLYGMTYSGGASNLGTVFRINTDGSSYAVLKSFTRSDGANPRGSGLTLSGTNLFGATYYGGTSNGGVVFRLSTDGSSYTVLRDFTDISQGLQPWCDLALSGTALFGTTEYGGDTKRGTVFSLNTDGTGFNVLKSFQGSDGSEPLDGLTLSGTTLFGTTVWGGTSNCGTVFRLETNGSGFGVIKNFTGSDGVNPYVGLIASGTMLYGTTYVGGASNVGTIFQLDTTTSNYTVLKHCRLSDGAHPYTRLTLSGTTLFGTTDSGGASGYGVVFALVLPTATPTVVVCPHDQTVLAGDTPAFTAHTSATPPPAYQWFRDGAIIASATNSVLQLTNVQPWQADPYAVVISNASGTATSSPAMLSVIVPGTRPVATPTEAALRAALAGSAPVTFACDGTIFLTSTLSIASDTLLDGSGHQVTISGGGLVPVLSIGQNVTLTLRNLTIANGLAVGSGGGVYNGGGTLNAEQCTFSGNGAYQPAAGQNADGSAASGGAIYNGGAITLDRCAVVENWAVGGGGGAGRSASGGQPQPSRGGNGGIGTGGAIHNTSTMTLHACLLSSNGAIGGLGGQGGDGMETSDSGDHTGGLGGLGGEASGGALYNSGTATAINCTFIGNAEIAAAGGQGGHGGAWILNPHQYIGSPGGNGGNGGSGFGAIADPGGLLHLVNCTVAGNSAAAGSGGAGGVRGSGNIPPPNGVAGTNGTAWGGVNSVGSSLVNTILSANLPGGNWSGTLWDLGHNLSSDATCGFTNSGSLNSTDPLLGPLAANGGPTLTLALLPGSPAVDAGDTSAAPAIDQRGYPRPFGSAADIGAFEYGSFLLLLGITSGPGGFDISVSGATNRFCALLTATKWGAWTAVVTNQADADGTTLFHVGRGAEPCRYYRVFSP